jgi:ABC-type branched-subunit amino acid transport system substrate-binding protein
MTRGVGCNEELGEIELVMNTQKMIALFFLFSFLIVAHPLIPFSEASSAGPLTTKEKWGKEIYIKTASPSGKEIKALVGIASIEAPGSTMSCVNCHGHDGRGKPESGIIPTNITWGELTKSYGVRHSSGREHPAYTEETLARAIIHGIDPAGNRLDSAMPVYSMPEQDLGALVAYLKRLGADLDPGLSETTIRVGTILPPRASLGEVGEGIEKTLQAYFDEINERGGIYHRKLKLVVKRGDENASLTKEHVKTFIQEGDLFALVSTFTPGLDAEIPSLVEGETIPLVGPFTLFPTTEVVLNRYLFYIFSGIREQALALTDYAARHIRMESPRMTILHPARTDLEEIVKVVEDQCKGIGWKGISRFQYPVNSFDATALTRRLKNDNVDLVLFLGNESEAGAFFRELKQNSWTPYLLLPGVLAGKSIFDIPSRFRNKIFLAYPTLPEDRKERGTKELRALSEKYHLPIKHSAAQISAHAAAQILLEGLKRAGRELSREKFITILENINEFDTGLTPLITYGPNRHIGALGAYIVSINPNEESKREFIASKEWVIPD